ncbi:MAG: hypothetical protein A2Y97_08740 [Nitrospirae bacterium RBG_13_39_12]|nr:MAG: hypothetical protein A2Y97_08740 [Nitrospirae bacterium RBG_13_39_12]
MKLMKLLRSEKGIALAMIVILAAIALIIMAGLISMITTGTQTSGMQKRYKTAYQAAVGGTDVFYQLIAVRGDPYIPGLNYAVTASSTCLVDKLTKSTKDWNAACDDSTTIIPGTATTYDMTLTIGNPAYTAYAKIVDTVDGNSGGDLGLIMSGVVSSGSGEIPVTSIPYLYTIEMDAENPANPSERAKLSILYEY